jgi:hypothetical protein
MNRVTTVCTKIISGSVYETAVGAIKGMLVVNCPKR